MFCPNRSRVFHPILAVMLAGSSAALAADEPQVDQARAMLKLFLDQKFEQLNAAGNDLVRAKLSPAVAKQAFEALRQQIGDYESETSAKHTRSGELDVVDLGCKFTRGTCTLRVALDDDGRLAGFLITSLDADFAYEWPEYVDTSRFREEEVLVSAGKLELKATLTLPTGDGPHPAVLLVHGSGPHDRDETVGANKPFRDLAGGLASRGVAVLRYVKRTKAHPFAKPRDEWTLDDETIDDAVAAAALLRAHRAIDKRRVFIAGHSLGGMAAPFIAQRDKKLAGLIVLAGSARSILDLLDDQLPYIAKLDGDFSAQEREQVRKLKEATAAIRAGRHKEMTEPILGMSARYWAHLAEFKPAPAAAELNIPMLIVQGGRDYQVTKADFAVWKKHLAGRDDVAFALFDNLNHLFVPGRGPSGPGEYQQAGHVDRRVIERIADWIHDLKVG